MHNQLYPEVLLEGQSLNADAHPIRTGLVASKGETLVLVHGGIRLVDGVSGRAKSP